MSSGTPPGERGPKEMTKRPVPSGPKAAPRTQTATSYLPACGGGPASIYPAETPDCDSPKRQPRLQQLETRVAVEATIGLA
jgi:hypothetical protein